MKLRALTHIEQGFIWQVRDGIEMRSLASAGLQIDLATPDVRQRTAGLKQLWVIIDGALTA